MLVMERHIHGSIPHCAAMRSRKSRAISSSGPGSGLMKTMRSFGWERLALRRWMPIGILIRLIPSVGKHQL